jgi:hypothetical protein
MYIFITFFVLGCQCNKFTYTSLMEVFTQTKCNCWKDDGIDKKRLYLLNYISFGIFIFGYSQLGLSNLLLTWNGFSSFHDLGSYIARVLSYGDVISLLIKHIH